LLNGNILTGDQRELRIVNYELRTGHCERNMDHGNYCYWGDYSRDL